MQIQISPPKAIRADSLILSGLHSLSDWGFSDFVNPLISEIKSVTSTSGQFDCYAVNITGDGIDTISSSLVVTPSSTYGSHCRPLGLVSKTIGSGGGVLDINVPKGGTKQIQVLGIHSNGGCGSGGSFADDFSSSGTGTFREVSEIAYVSANVDGDTSITIDTSYDPANAKNLIECDAGANLSAISGNLKMWYRADFFHGIATDGSAYSSATDWTDRAQASFSLGNDGTNIPVYYATGGPNGQPALDYTGSKYNLRGYGASQPMGNSLTGITLVAVGTTSVSGGILFGITDNSSFNTADYIYLGNRGASNFVAEVKSSSAYSVMLNPLNSDFNIHIAIFDSPNMSLKYYVGALSGNNATTAILPSFGVSTSYGYIGKYENPSATYLTGKVSEVIAFDKALTSSELSILKQYLYKRYQLSVSTP